MGLPLPQPSVYAQSGGQNQPHRLQELRPYPPPPPPHGQSGQYHSSSQQGYHPPPPHQQTHQPIHPNPAEQPSLQQIPPIAAVLPERQPAGYGAPSYPMDPAERRDYPPPHHPGMYHGHTLPGHGDETPPEHNRTRRRNNPVHVSVAGDPRYPSPSPKREERARFTAEDDRKLKKLKEEYDLTWRQIEEFFPGRQSGTLQVRYCTKLKERQEINWTQQHDARLRTYIREYDSNKWKTIATKMGHNFTAQACEERARDIESAPEAGPEAYAD